MSAHVVKSIKQVHIETHQSTCCDDVEANQFSTRFHSQRVGIEKKYFSNICDNCLGKKILIESGCDISLVINGFMVEA